MARTGIPDPPTGLKAAGRRLWRATLQAFELEEHERLVLTQAARCADTCEALQAVVDAEGVLTESGLRAHPALVELRQQRIALARLLASLRVPTGDDGEVSSGARGQRHSGVRGVYPLRGAS